MEFKFNNSNRNNEVLISKNMVKRIISLLDKVDCTCVWSNNDNQYIKVNDIPKDIVDELTMKLKFTK